MARITVSTLVAAPPVEVWNDIERLECHVEWMTDVESITFTGESRRGVGTRMSVLTRIGPFRTTDQMEFVSWDPPREMAVRHHGLFTGLGRFTLESVARGTRLTWSEEIVFPWWLGGPIGAWLARPILAFVWRRNLARLRNRF